MMDEENKRWAVLTLDLISGTVTVSDIALEKNKTYHIPFLIGRRDGALFFYQRSVR